MTGARRVNKAACKRLAAELRAEIGLSEMDELDPWALADLYGVRVIALRELPVESDVLKHFTVDRPGVFSGALIPVGGGAIVVENDSHPIVRRRSTLGHEVAHVVAEHTFGASLTNERGCRMTDVRQEEEAAEIAGELLIPFDAARRLARRKAPNEEVAAKFGVSVEFARWRMDSTGARIIAQRQAAAYQRSVGY